MKSSFLKAGAASAIAAGLLAFAAQGAVAGPKVVERARQPVGTPHKASALAPHRTNRRTFGDPIQTPILRHVAPKKPPP